MDALVVAVGLVTPVGLSCAETAASARARVARLQAVEWVDRHFDPFIVGRVPDAGLAPLDPELMALELSRREQRMLQLGHVALDEALSALPAGSRAVPLLLGMPEHPLAGPADMARFLVHLAVQSKAHIDIANSVAAARGRASGAMAIRQAMMRLERQQAEFVLVGGIDSLSDPALLRMFDAEERVRGENVSDGFSPSEGAAMLLLTSDEQATRHRLPVLARIRGASLGKEAGHWYSSDTYRGDGLASTFAHLLESADAGRPVACVYATFNGERYWSREFATARLRNAEYFAENLQMEHPAECFGDMGAAFGTALVALAAHGLAGGYRPAPCLVYAASDFGERAAILLDSAA